MYFNRSYDSLWPSRINSSMVAGLQECLDFGPLGVALPPRCPFNMMPEISQWLINNYNRGSAPNLTKSADLGVIRYLTSSHEDTAEHANNTVQGYSIGSTATTYLARCLDCIWLYAEKQKFNMIKPARPLISLSSSNDKYPLRRPLVQVQCGFPYDITHTDTIKVTFPTDQLHNKSGRVFEALNLSSTVNTSVFRNIPSGPIFQWVDFSETTNRPLWGALVGMKFFSPRLMYGSSFTGAEAYGLMPCTIESHWIPTKMGQDILFGGSLVLDNANPIEVVRDAKLMANALDLYIDRSYLDAVNTPVHDRNPPLGVIAWELNWLSAKPGNGFDGLWKERWPWIVATVLSLQLTDALSRYADWEPLYYWDVPTDLPINESYVVDLRYIYSSRVYNYALPKQYGYDFANHIRGSPELYTEVKWTVERFGYAWGFRRATKYLAAIVIISHAILVLLHTSFVVGRRWRCDNWTSLTELLVLAMQSPRSKLLERSTACTSKHSKFTSNVQILEDIGEGERVVLEVSAENLPLRTPDASNQEEDEFGRGGTDARKLKVEKKYL